MLLQFLIISVRIRIGFLVRFVALQTMILRTVEDFIGKSMDLMVIWHMIVSGAFHGVMGLSFVPPKLKIIASFS
jgi:ABC-type uncharacterized transport system permease subunit